MRWYNQQQIIETHPGARKKLQKDVPQYEIVSEMIRLRKALDLTQSELAELVGTRQSNISRLERGDSNPTLGFLTKIAHALGKDLEVTLR